MPFIGQDWRAPGDFWIKTDEGWERMTLIQKSHLQRIQHSYESKKPEASRKLTIRATSSSSLVSSASSCSDSEIDLDAAVASSSTSSASTSASSSPGPDITLPAAVAAAAEAAQRNEQEYSVVEIIERLDKSSSRPIPEAILKESSHAIETQHLQPFCRVLVNPTREVVGSNIISEAFFKLDFCNAIHDIRRFRYVSKLLHLLIEQNLTTLSGNGTRALFWMLEEIAKQVAKNKQDIHVVRDLISELNKIVDNGLCWGQPLGSTSLWEQHLKTLERICELTDSIELGVEASTLDDLGAASLGPPGVGASWNSLPEELIREILYRIADYKDLDRTAEACHRSDVILTEEQHVWRKLCKYHFSKDQLKWAEREIKHDKSDWQATFHVVRKKFGLKEEYPDCLFLCRYCSCLFWNSRGHPCALENPDLTTQLTNNVSNTESRSKSEIMASLKEKLTEINTKVRSPPATGNATNSQANVQSANSLARASGRSQESQQFQQSRRCGAQQSDPVVVQNVPFLHQPIVVVQRSQHSQQSQEHAESGAQSSQRPPQSNRSREPFHLLRQRFQNLGNVSNQARENQGNESSNDTGRAYTPKFVPITPHEFLKFFSL